MAGMSLIMASGCVANNIIDRSIDKRMERTKKRALVTGEITVSQALIFAVLLAIAGFGLLILGTNWLTVLVGALAYADYVALYAIAKRHSTWSTVVGSVSGALPPVGGYVALSGHFDINALLLFTSMVTWQMPHFYSIGLFRRKDYNAAHVPLLTVRAPRTTIATHCVIYGVVYLISNIALWHYGSASTIFVCTMTVLGIWWLTGIIRGFSSSYNDKWARSVFGQSLIVLTAWCVLLIANYWLP